MGSESFSLIAASRLGKMRVFEGSIPQIISIDNQLLISSQSDYMIVSKAKIIFGGLKRSLQIQSGILFLYLQVFCFIIFLGVMQDKKILISKYGIKWNRTYSWHRCKRNVK